MTNEEVMRKTFSLALKGLGTTWPNPLVGSVIVKDGKIVSEGYHLKKGEAHAELDAINNANGISLEGATLFVNLEPCCHTNKTTPPCAQRIIKEKIKKVVICNLDPNPSVNGKGVELLRSNGIEVEYGILEAEGEKINEVFFTAQRLKRPFVHFKSAVTLDGKTAMNNGESQWITGEAARNEVHQMRAHHQGIIVGGETVRKDNPRLTVRLPNFKGEQPWRIVISRKNDFSQSLNLFSDEWKHKTLVYSDIDAAMKDLFQKNILSVMLEAGPLLAGEFLKRKLIDRVTLFQNPSFLGAGRDIFGDLNLPDLNHRPKLFDLESTWIGADQKITGRLLCSQD